MATLVRREVRDALSDWRTFLPTIVLTLFLPLLVRAATVYVINFVNEPGLAAKIIPFTLLLVGFVPASFSLIPALEIFVGERERNTLESLLAMPVADRQLYLGKYVAAATPPLLSSGLAMLTFGLSIGSSRRVILHDTLPLGVFAAIALLVMIKALTMVAAAVLISARTTSIRSANLLASFVIIPMSVLLQVEALLLIGEPPRRDIVALIGLGLATLAAVLVGLGMASFSREAVLSREHRPAFGERRAGPLAVSRRPVSPLATVIDRELRDTLTDWRILMPILLLALVLPILLLGAANYAISATGAPAAIARLVPFGLLLVGFLPASFSLITALESFVGEKERGTLEALLAMPLSDSEIYFGKLLATLTTPLFSGLLAMGIFASGLVGFGDPLLAAQVTRGSLVSMAALVILIAFTMVAGAVVISSHTSSIRVSNLLASFILLPMSVAVQLIALLVISNRFEVIGLMGLGVLLVGLLLVRAGMRSFNREETLSREHEQLNLRGTWQTFSAFFRQYGPPTMPPEARQLPFSHRRFYRQELPAMLGELRWPLLIMGGAVGLSVVFGTVYDPENRTQLMQLLVPVERLGRVPSGGPQLALLIFLSNSWRFFFAGLLSTISFGLFATIITPTAFLSVAYGAAWAERHGTPLGGLGFLLAYVLPHGVVELPAAILGSAAGLRLGVSLVGTPPGISVGRHLLWALALYLRLLVSLIMPLLAIAALLEGLVTPLVAGLVYGG